MSVTGDCADSSIVWPRYESIGGHQGQPTSRAQAVHPCLHTMSLAKAPESKVDRDHGDSPSAGRSAAIHFEWITASKHIDASTRLHKPAATGPASSLQPANCVIRWRVCDCLKLLGVNVSVCSDKLSGLADASCQDDFDQHVRSIYRRQLVGSTCFVDDRETATARFLSSRGQPAMDLGGDLFT